MIKSEIEAAMQSHRTSNILRDVMEFLITQCHCPEANGRHGPQTYPDCGKCVYCVAKEYWCENHDPEIYSK